MVVIGARNNENNRNNGVAKSYGADLLVDCSGFGNQASQRLDRGIPFPLIKWNRPLRVGSKLRFCDEKGDTFVRLDCTSVTPLRSDSRQKRYSGTVQRVFGRSALSEAIPFETALCLPENLGRELEAAIYRSITFLEAPPLYLASSVLPLLYTITNGQYQPVARKEEDKPIYYIGPQAALPPTEPVDAKENEPIRTPSENRVALWRYAETVTAFAEYFAVNAANSVNAVNPSPDTLVTGKIASLLQPQTLEPLEELQSTGQSRTVSTVFVAESLVKPGGTAPYFKDSERRFRYLILEHLQGFRLPAVISSKRNRNQSPNRAGETFPAALHLRFTPTLSAVSAPESSPLALIAESEGRLAQRVNLEPLLTSLLQDEDLQRLLLQWGFPTSAFMRSGKVVTIRIPLRVRGRGSRFDYFGEIERTVRKSSPEQQ